jgi:ferredoxin-type protein NapH
LSAIFAVAAFEVISPIGFLHREIIFGIGSGWAVILMLVFFDFGIVKNGWCGHLCPLGAFYSLVGRFGLLKVKHNKDNCTNCNKCFVVCPEVQVLSIVGKEDGFVTSGECTNCLRCIEVCDDDALNFSIKYVFKKNG